MLPFGDVLKAGRLGKAALKLGSKGSKSFKGVSESFLKKNGIKDIHAFKSEWLGTNKNLKFFDVVKNTTTNELMIIRKNTQEIITNTQIIAK